VGQGSIVGLVTIIVSLCTTSVVSDFVLIIIVRGLHCVNSRTLSKGAWTCIPPLVLFRNLILVNFSYKTGVNIVFELSRSILCKHHYSASKRHTTYQILSVQDAHTVR